MILTKLHGKCAVVCVYKFWLVTIIYLSSYLERSKELQNVRRNMWAVAFITFTVVASLPHEVV